MKNLGIFLCAFGVLYILLTLFGINYGFATWIDSWGESIGWSIRGGSLFVGILAYCFALYLEANREPETAEET